MSLSSWETRGKCIKSEIHFGEHSGLHTHQQLVEAGLPIVIGLVGVVKWTICPLSQNFLLQATAASQDVWHSMQSSACLPPHPPTLFYCILPPHTHQLWTQGKGHSRNDTGSEVVDWGSTFGLHHFRLQLVGGGSYYCPHVKSSLNAKNKCILRKCSRTLQHFPAENRDTHHEWSLGSYLKELCLNPTPSISHNPKARPHLLHSLGMYKSVWMEQANIQTEYRFIGFV